MKKFGNAVGCCLVLIIAVASCDQKPEPQHDFDINGKGNPRIDQASRASSRVDLSTKGVGPVRNLALPDTIDRALALRGKHIYEENCTLCHKPDEKFIGPAPAGILERRTPEWVMNMILAPELMLKEDSLAMDLFLEYNGSPMANQQLTEQEARAILEYFRTL